MEKYLLANVKSQLDAYTIQVEAESANIKRSRHTQNLVDLNEQLRRLNFIFLSGNISDSEYAFESKRLNEDIEKARKQAETEKPVNLGTIKAFLSSGFLENYHTLTKQEQQRMWRSVIEEIKIDGTTPTGIKPRS